MTLLNVGGYLTLLLSYCKLCTVVNTDIIGIELEYN